MLDFIYQHNPNLVNKIKEPNFENIGDKLILANHSLKQLNIIDDIYKGKHSSVVTLLNKCITSMGKRTFVYKFLNPTTNISFLEKEYNIIEHCLQNNGVLYNYIKNELIKISDIIKFSRQMIIQKITPKNLYQLHTSIQHISKVYDIVKKDAILMNYLKEKIPEIDNLLDYVNEITDFIESNLDIQKCNNIDSLQKLECNLIKPNVNAELDTKVMNLTNSQDKLESCRKYFHNVLVNYESSTKKTKAKAKTKTNTSFGDDEDVVSNEYEYVKIHETEKNNYSLIATERRCKILEDVIKKTPHKIELQYISSLDKEIKVFELDMTKNSIVFAKQSSSNRTIGSYQINELCKNISSMKTQLNDLVSKVYSQIVCDLCKFQKQLDILSEFIIYIDFVFSKVYVAKEYG